MTQTYEPIRLTLPVASKGRELRAGADSHGWSKVHISIYHDPSAPRAAARVVLNRSELHQLIHMLHTLDDSLEDRRDQWIATAEGQQWLRQQSAAEAA